MGKLLGRGDPERTHLQPQQMRVRRKHSCCLYCIPRGTRPTPCRASRRGSQEGPRVPGTAIPWEPTKEAPELETQDQS